MTTAPADKCSCGRENLLALVSTKTGLPTPACSQHFEQRLRENIAAGSSQNQWKERR